MAFRAWLDEESWSERSGSGWLFGIPNPFPFGTGDIFGGSIFETWNPFPSGTSAPGLPDVISERPTEIVPEGWETVIIAGEERLRVPDVYNEGTPGVFEQFDPDVVIGEVQGVDTAAQTEDDVVAAHDWGSWFRTGISAVAANILGDDPQQTVYGPGSTTNQIATAAAMGGNGNGDGCGMVWAGGVPPKGYKVVNSCGVGVLRKVRRRRRRRLLTRGDSQDIATIVGLVGKGQMASSLINRRT